MNEQTRATSTTATAMAPAECGALAATPPEDAWDRLAALAFGGVGGASAGGCSEHAHACACRAAYPELESEAVD